MWRVAGGEGYRGMYDVGIHVLISNPFVRSSRVYVLSINHESPHGSFGAACCVDKVSRNQLRMHACFPAWKLTTPLYSFLVRQHVKWFSSSCRQGNKQLPPRHSLCSPVAGVQVVLEHVQGKATFKRLHDCPCAASLQVYKWLSSICWHLPGKAT